MGTEHRTLALTAVAPMTWGTTYLVASELLPDGRPLLASLLRALPAGLVLVAATRAVPSGSWWWRAAVLGTLNIGAFFPLLFLAAFRLPGGVAATLGAIQPLVGAALAALVLGERLRTTTVVAGIAGMVGVALLVLRAGAALDGVGVLAGLGGAVAMASGVVLTKRWRAPVPLLAFTGWQLVAGGLLLLPVTLVVEGTPPAPTVAHLVGFLWLGSVGTVAAYALWFRGIAELRVAQVVFLGLLSPVVATLAGWAVLGQSLTAGQALGVLTVLGAVWLAQRPTVAPGTPTDRPGAEILHVPPSRCPSG